MLLTANSAYPIGLDISDLSLKLVQLDKVRDKIKIRALSKMNLPAGIITKGEIKNQGELIKAIRKIVSSPLYGKVNSEEAVACLPESKTFIKLIDVQKSPNTLADVISSEVEKHVPLAVSEIYYDWQVIEDLADKYLVLIGAAPKNIVNQYTALLDEAKLSPLALEIEPMAIARCLLKEEAPGRAVTASQIKARSAASQNYGIIDIGASHTCMIFYSGNTILFTISMPISGEEITDKIAKSLNLAREQAEKAKIICGLDETRANGIIREVLIDMTKNLLEKIKEAIQYYKNYFSRRGPLNLILLCGGGANTAKLAEIMKKELQIETKMADALININENKDKFNEFFLEKHSLDFKTTKLNLSEKEKKLSVQQNSSSAYATAVGLALRRIFIDEI